MLVLGFFYFILNSLPLTCDVTCMILLRPKNMERQYQRNTLEKPKVPYVRLFLPRKAWKSYGFKCFLKNILRLLGQKCQKYFSVIELSYQLWNFVLENIIVLSKNQAFQIHCQIFIITSFFFDYVLNLF